MNIKLVKIQNERQTFKDETLNFKQSLSKFQKKNVRSLTQVLICDTCYVNFRIE